MILVTDRYDKPIYINAEYICSVSSDRGGSKIRLVNGDEIAIEETPELFLGRIRRG